MEEAVGLLAELLASDEHLVDFGTTLRDGELAAAQPADLALRLVRAEGLVDGPQPVEGRLERGGIDVGVAQVDLDGHAHDVLDAQAPAASAHRLGIRGQRRTLRGGCCAAGPGLAQRAADHGDHAGRPAEEDVAIAKVGHELIEVGGGEQVSRRGVAVVAHDVVQPDPVFRRQLVELVAEHDVVVGQRPIDDGDVGRRREVVEQRPDRRDPDAAGDQRQTFVAPGVRGEPPERAVGDHGGAGRDRPEPGGVVARGLDGDAQPLAMGSGRQREWMGLPPHARGEEAPDEELAGPRSEAIEMAPADVERDDAGRFADDLLNPQPMPPRPHQRDEQAKEDHET